MNIQCFYHFNGCSTTTGYEKLEEHQQTCGFRAVPCEGCGNLHCIRDIDNHKNQCGLIQLKCDQCDKNLTRDEMKQHGEVACLQGQVRQMKETIKILSAKVLNLERKCNSKR